MTPKPEFDIPTHFIEEARRRLADECMRHHNPLRAKLYRNGSNDDQPELTLVARILRDITPRPLHELIEEENARRIFSEQEGRQ